MVNEAGPSTSFQQNNGGDLSALIDDVQIDDVDEDWLKCVNRILISSSFCLHF